jgi:salicylate hydroxylase
MDVAIVGAGIAGLAASIALTRAGHRVVVYEKSRFKNEIGAAITITPNGNRVLRRWGFDFERARPVDFKVFRYVRFELVYLLINGLLSFVGYEAGRGRECGCDALTRWLVSGNAILSC